MMKDIQFDEIKKVVFQKGDILILRHRGRLPAEAYDHIKETCELALDKVGLKGDVGIMVLEEGMDISVLTQTGKDEIHGFAY
jgi:hypothetical protein